MQTAVVTVGNEYEQCDIEHDSAREIERATQLRYGLASAGGSWGREFRELLTLAEARQVRLDSERLVYYDVRDLQALQRRLVTAGAKA